MTVNRRELLFSQLSEALHADIDVCDIAVVAELLRRLNRAEGSQDANEQALLLQAQRRCEIRDTEDVLPGPEAISELVQTLCEYTDKTDCAEQEERMEIVWQLDEACAASAFLGKPDRYKTQIDEATAIIRAFPELFQSLVATATEVLSCSRFSTGDPARSLWSTIESCGFDQGLVTEYVPQCHRARRALGFLDTCSLGAARQTAHSLQAATGISMPSPLEIVCKDTFGEIGVGRDEAGDLRLFLQCSEGECPPIPELFCNGESVPLTTVVENLFTAPVQTGEYLLRVGPHDVRFSLVDRFRFPFSFRKTGRAKRASRTCIRSPS